MTVIRLVTPKLGEVQDLWHSIFLPLLLQSHNSGRKYTKIILVLAVYMVIICVITYSLAHLVGPTCSCSCQYIHLHLRPALVLSRSAHV